MPRQIRNDRAGQIYHALNRGNQRQEIFYKPGDYDAFIRVMAEGLRKYPVELFFFTLMDNHLHVLLRLDPDEAKTRSNADVVERWFQLYPPRASDRKVLSGKALDELKKKLAADAKWVATARERLSSLSWFMKNLKEPLSRLVNKEEKCTGAFFEGRFKSIAILDEKALLSVCAYIDLNPMAAGIARAPEESEHTSDKVRVDHVKRLGRNEDLTAAREGSVSASRRAKRLEEGLWLAPIQDRPRQVAQQPGISRVANLRAAESTG